MIVTLRGGPYNGQKVVVPDGARIWYCTLLEPDDKVAVDLTQRCNTLDGVYAEGEAGSGNFYWLGVE